MSALTALLGGIVGAGIGFAIGGPFGAAALGARIGFLAGAFIASALSAKDVTLEGARAHELRLTGSAYGTPIPILFGTSKLPSNVFWAADPPIAIIKHEESNHGGSFFETLLGGPKVTKTSYTYEATFAVMLSDVAIGDAASLLKIYFDDDLVADYTLVDGPFIKEDLRGSITFHNGSADQVADSTMVALDGATTTSAHRGKSYIVFNKLPVDRSIPRVSGVVSAKTAPDVFPLVTIDPVNQLGVGMIQWGPDGKTLWINAQANGPLGLVIVDTASATIIREMQSLDFVNFGSLNQLTDFSRNGEKFFLAAEDLFFGDRMIKFSVDTLEVEGMSPDLGFRPHVFRAFPTTDKLLVVSGETSSVSILTSTENVDQLTLLHPTLDIQDTYSLNDYLTGTGWIGKDIILDGEGYLWILAINSEGADDSLALIKTDRGFGFPLQTYVIAQFDTSVLGVYDIVTNSFIIIGIPNMFFRWSLDTFDIVVDKGADGPTSMRRGDLRAPINGRLWMDKDIDEFEEYDTVTLNRLRTLDSTDWGIGTTLSSAFYDPVNHAVWRTSTTHLLYRQLIDRIGTPGTTTVREIVEGVSTRVGLDASADIDASALTSTIPGYPLLRRSKARSFIEPLAAVFFFDQREEDWKIEYIKRGGAAVLTIPESDLGAHITGSETPAVLTEKMVDELQVPARVDFTFINPNAQYEQGVAHWQRPSEVINTKDLKTINIGVVIGEDTAKQMLHKMMKLLWTDRNDFSFTLTRRYTRLSVGDVINIVKDSITHTVNITKLDRGANGITEVSASTDDPPIYTSTVTGTPQDGVLDENIGTVATTIFRISDIPAIRVDDIGLFSYAAAGGIGTGIWDGVALHRAEDGIDFSTEAALVESDQNSSLGLTIDKLESASAFRTDRVNSLTIRLFSGSLATVTESALLNGLATGVNVLIVGREVIQAATVVDNSDGTFTLSDFLRGRRGTELEIDNHEIGDLVTVVDFDKLVKVTMVAADVTKELDFATRNIGSVNLNSPIRELTYRAEALMPMPVAKVNGSITSDDWTFTFHRRSRFTRARPFLTPTVGESGEVYKCDILSGPGGTILRTITKDLTDNGSYVDASVPNVFYDGADQVIDFGSVQTTITFKIYMISGTPVGTLADGRGFANEVTLPRTSIDVDPNWDDVVLLLRANGKTGSTKFIDYSDSAHELVANGNAQISEARSKFGVSSYLGDGSADWIDTTDGASDFDFGTANFTIAAFIYKEADTGIKHIISRGASTASLSSWYFYLNNGVLKFLCQGIVKITEVNRFDELGLNDQWVHVAVVRKGKSTMLFINGLLVAETIDAAAYDITTTAETVLIGTGANNTTTRSFNGNLEQVQVWNGTAKWTANFTPPTSPAPRR